MIQVETKNLALIAARLRLASKDFNKDMKFAAKDAKRRIAVDASRAAAEIYNVAAGNLTKRWQTSDPSADSFNLLGTRKPITAASFGAKAVIVDSETGKRSRVSASSDRAKAGNIRPGVSVKFLRSSRAKVVPRAWWPLKKPKPDIPWQRKGKAQYPIRPVLGPSCADMLKNPKVTGPLVEVAQGRMAEQVLKRFQKAISRG